MQSLLHDPSQKYQVIQRLYKANDIIIQSANHITQGRSHDILDDAVSLFGP